MWLACAAPAFAESVTLFRVFLNDGTAVVSYGEYARVGDRLVFSMPIGAVDGSGALRFKAAPDFDAPRDAGGLEARDGRGRRRSLADRMRQSRGLVEGPGTAGAAREGH